MTRRYLFGARIPMRSRMMSLVPSRVIPCVTPLAVALLVAGCSTEVAAPTNIVSPDAVGTVAAMTGMYQNAVFKMSQAFGGGVNGDNSFILASGVFADELTSQSQNLDAHQVTPLISNQIAVFSQLNGARTGAADATRTLAADGGLTPGSYVAELHAMQGYVYIMLSELYCSGVPFSALGNDGRMVYGHAESTTDMLNDAIAHFDSALAVSGDSVRITYLASVGKGRALLELGQYDDARQAVANVPSDFAYRFTYNADGPYGNFLSQAWAGAGNPFAFITFSLSSNEGTNGLSYLLDANTDPRLAVTGIFSPFGGVYYLPNKFPSGEASIPLADGTEARLIEAEAQIHDGQPGWLATLNALRTDGTYTTQTDPGDPTLTDTLWTPGTGSLLFTPAIAGLRPLTDPGTDSTRVALLFRERAYWMYLTGHRQGDMRRLIRQYRWLPALVYPIGTTDGIPPLVRVPDATIPVPASESDNNPNYSGCINRDA